MNANKLSMLLMCLFIPAIFSGCLNDDELNQPYSS